MTLRAVVRHAKAQATVTPNQLGTLASPHVGEPPMLAKLRPDERRSAEQLRQHYHAERQLATRLLNSRHDERARLYPALYDELFQRVPLHPQLTRTGDPELIGRLVVQKLGLVSSFLQPNTVFLELGAGDCRLSLAVAGRVKKVYALDVSSEITKGLVAPQNFELILSNGTDVPLPPHSVTVAYSYQLMEHIHPDDALQQLRNLYEALAPGGLYICITPNRLSGPHDISRYFDRVASGFHLKEYTLAELGDLFREVGFRKVNVYAGARGLFAALPLFPIGFLEKAIGFLPWRLQRPVADAPVLRNLLMAAVIGQKV